MMIQTNRFVIDTNVLRRMTHTFKAEKSGILANIPKEITTEEENEKFLAIVEELLHRVSLSQEEEILLERLIALIEEFEEQHYRLNASTPHSMLLHHMEARDIKQEDLIAVFGSREKTEAIASGTTEISIEDARALGKFFNLDPELFAVK